MSARRGLTTRNTDATYSIVPRPIRGDADDPLSWALESSGSVGLSRRLPSYSEPDESIQAFQYGHFGLLKAIINRSIAWLREISATGNHGIVSVETLVDKRNSSELSV
jgi:hypothetical protein